MSTDQLRAEVEKLKARIEELQGANNREVSRRRIANRHLKAAAETLRVLADAMEVRRNEQTGSSGNNYEPEYADW